MNPVILVLTLSTLVIFGCEPAGNEAAKNESNAVAQGAVAACSFKNPSNPSCISQDTFQITQACAEDFMDNWDCEKNFLIDNYKIAPADTGFLVRGFHIPRGELDSMLARLGPDANVYAMLAIKPETDNRGGTVFKTHLIFQAEARDEGGYYYFDFTKPCPNSCPE